MQFQRNMDLHGCKKNWVYFLFSNSVKSYLFYGVFNCSRLW
uniref:Uncharacterized protein n=1 Tax=Anguilla anguilla TaxID=7936 RepID=A0A0E9Q0M5_ANGAN